MHLYHLQTLPDSVTTRPLWASFDASQAWLSSRPQSHLPLLAATPSPAQPEAPQAIYRLEGPDYL